MSQVLGPHRYFNQSSSTFILNNLEMGWWGVGLEKPLIWLNSLVWQLEKGRPRDGGYLPRVTQLLVAKLEFLAAILALDQPCHVCGKLAAKPHVPGLPSCRCLALNQGVLLFWSIMGPWFSSFSGNLSFHFVSKHLVNSWNMSDIVPVTGLTALNRKDPKLELWGGLWRSPQYDWLKCRGGFCPSGSGEGSSGAMVFEQRLKEEPGGGDSVLN